MPLHESKTLTLEDIQQVEFSILQELDRICSTLGLNYMLAYGTLIGALRHDGFIPWDDDVDVVMPRKDYETLHDAFQKETIHSEYVLESYRTGNTFYSFSKLIDPHTHVEEYFVNQSTGLWVDIFPLERTDFNDKQLLEADKKRRKLQIKREIAISDPRYATSRAARVVKMLLQPYSKSLSAIELSTEMDNLARSVNALDDAPETSVRYVELMEEGIRFNSFSSDDLFPTRRHLFCGKDFPIPAKAEDILTMRYGDWQTLPPESERPASHFREVVYC